MNTQASALEKQSSVDVDNEYGHRGQVQEGCAQLNVFVAKNSQHKLGFIVTS